MIGYDRIEKEFASLLCRLSIVGPPLIDFVVRLAVRCGAVRATHFLILFLKNGRLLLFSEDQIITIITKNYFQWMPIRSQWKNGTIS